MDTNEPNAIGVFDDLRKAEQTIDELRLAGFRSDEIGIIGHVGQAEAIPTPREMQPPEENATSGILQGGIVGAVVGALVILVIPGLGEVSGFGRWFELVGGAALGAVVSGVLIAFGSFFFYRTQTRFIANQLEKGRFIITVKNVQRKEEAMSVLRRQGLATEKLLD